MKYTPVLLLTGYLGSGKTTLLNRILSNRKGIRFAVIVNDIGEVNIDASLIQKGGLVSEEGRDLVALQNGCICCTLKMDLVEQLREISIAGKFDYIVIEASGICEPEPIARTICSIPYMGERYATDGMAHLDSIVTVVDALRLSSEFSCAKDLLRGNIGEDDLEKLVIEQIEFCNTILLNKSSEVSPEQLGRISAIIRTIQPKARIIPCDYCNVPLEDLLNTNLFDYESVSASAAWVSAVEGDGDDAPQGEALEYGIGTYVYQARRPLDINKFDNFIAKRFPAGVIRSKGICYFSDQKDACYLFEQAGSQVSLKNIGAWYATMPEDELRERLESDPALRRDWDPEYGDRCQKLVFIGQGLDTVKIRAELDFCLDEG